MEEIDLFNGRADLYAKARPSYAEQLLAVLKKDYCLENSIVADVGSGTGIFSKQLLDMKNEVYGVEPNVDMRLKAEQALANYPLFHSVAGGAENTTLPDCSCDFVTVATAFHWFNADLFKKECQRILKDKKRVVIVNNEQQDTPILVAKDKMLRQYSEFYAKVSDIFKIKDKIDAFFESYQKVEFEYNFILNQGLFLQNCLSKSYSLNPNDVLYEAYLAELNKLFSIYAIDNFITLKYKSIAYIGTI